MQLKHRPTPLRGYGPDGSAARRHPLRNAVAPLVLRSTWALPRPSRLPRGSRWRGPHQQRPLRPRRQICLAPYAGWLTLHARRHHGEVGPLAWGVMLPGPSPPAVASLGRGDARLLAQPLSGPLQAGVGLLPPPLPAAPRARLAARFPGRPSCRGGDGLTTFRHCSKGGEGRSTPPVGRHLRRGKMEPPDLPTRLLAHA